MPRAHHHRPPSCARPVVAGLILLLTGLAACAPQRQPLPLDPDGGPPLVVEPPPRAVADEPEAAAVEAGTGLIEEALLPEEPVTAATTPTPPAGAAAMGTVGTGTAASASPTPDQWATAPSPLAALRPGTPPNVAAATRLAEAARLRLTAGDDAVALEQLERAIAIDGSNPYAYFFLATLHLRHRTYDQAIAFADRAASLSEPAAPEWASRAYALQGSAYESVGRFVDARAAYGRAVRAAPANAAAQAGLARVGGGTAP